MRGTAIGLPFRPVNYSELSAHDKDTKIKTIYHVLLSEDFV